MATGSAHGSKVEIEIDRVTRFRLQEPNRVSHGSVAMAIDGQAVTATHAWMDTLAPRSETTRAHALQLQSVTVGEHTREAVCGKRTHRSARPPSMTQRPTVSHHRGQPEGGGHRRRGSSRGRSAG